MEEGRNLPSSLHTIRSSREPEIPLSFPSECLPRMVYLRLQSFNNSKLVVTLPFLKTQITTTVYETIEPSQWP